MYATRLLFFSTFRGNSAYDDLHASPFFKALDIFPGYLVSGQDRKIGKTMEYIFGKFDFYEFDFLIVLHCLFASLLFCLHAFYILPLSLLRIEVS
jgi:hypothetical protein